MSERPLSVRILEELSYTNLSTARLAAILDARVSDLKVELNTLVEDTKIRDIEFDGEKKWQLV